MNCLGINFPITRTICYTKGQFPNYLCNHFGPHGNQDTFNHDNPDPPILAFFVFLAFFALRFSLLFCAFLLSFPRISRVLQGGKSSLFSGHPRFFAKEAGIGGSGKGEKSAISGKLLHWIFLFQWTFLPFSPSTLFTLQTLRSRATAILRQSAKLPGCSPGTSLQSNKPSHIQVSMVHSRHHTCNQRGPKSLLEMTTVYSCPSHVTFFLSALYFCSLHGTRHYDCNTSSPAWISVGSLVCPGFVCKKKGFWAEKKLVSEFFV